MKRKTSDIDSSHLFLDFIRSYGFDPNNYENILVINLMHLGDLLLVTPVLRTLRAKYPKARISLLADK